MKRTKWYKLKEWKNKIKGEKLKIKITVKRCKLKIKINIKTLKIKSKMIKDDVEKIKLE